MPRSSLLPRPPTHRPSAPPPAPPLPAPAQPGPAAPLSAPSGSEGELQEAPERHRRHGPLGLVARAAGGDEIVELVRAAPAARDDVVDGRRALFVEGLAAVGAAVPVTFDQRGDDAPGPPFAGVVAGALPWGRAANADE